MSRPLEAQAQDHEMPPSQGLEAMDYELAAPFPTGTTPAGGDEAVVGGGGGGEGVRGTAGGQEAEVCFQLLTSTSPF